MTWLPRITCNTLRKNKYYAIQTYILLKESIIKLGTTATMVEYTLQILGIVKSLGYQKAIFYHAALDMQHILNTIAIMEKTLTEFHIPHQ